MANLPTIVSTQHIQLKYIFGLNPNIRNNLYFQDEEKIIYPSGYHITLYDLKDKTQLYYQGVTDYRGISCMTLSPLRRFLALGVKGVKIEKADKPEKPAIVVYDTFTQKKKKILVFNEANVKQWISIAFAPSSMETKTLISLSGGGGEVVACFWQHDKNKCQAWVRLSQAPIDAFEIAFNNNDATFISCIGKKVFKCYKKMELVDEQNKKSHQMKTVCQQLNGCPSELTQNYTCHAWLTCENQMVMGTTSGELILCNENGEFIQVLKDSPIFFLKNTWNVECITTYSKGFIIAGDNAFIYVYKSTGIETNPYEVQYKLNLKLNTDFKDLQIKGLSISPHSEDRIVCSLNSCLIYQIRLRKDNVYSEHEDQVEKISLDYHCGQINGMDICVRKPLVATCGSDKCIKVWNYEDRSIELSWQFNEEAQCISFHPSGFYIAVAFSDRLKLMNINICINSNSSNTSKNKHYKEIAPFKGCKEIKFSNGGQYFAAVNGNNIICIYKFYTGELKSQLKGHTSRIKSLCWSKDDTIIVSCGQDGLIYGFNINDENRICDYHQKAQQLNCVILTADSKLIYAPGTDRNIHSLQVADSQGDKKPLDIMLSQIAFPSSNKILFGGVCDESRSSGVIRCYLYPLTHGKYNDYIAHDEHGIEKLRVTNDDHYIISAGRDGGVMIFEIKDKDARGIKFKEGYPKASEEILVTRADLDDLKNTKDQLNQQLTDFSNNQNSVLNLSGKDDQIKQLQERLQTSCQQHKTNYETLMEKKKELEKKHEEDLKACKEKYETEIQELDTSYQKKVMDEVEKFENQKRLHEVEFNKNNKKKAKMLQDHATKIKMLDEDYQSKLDEQRAQRERVQKEIAEKKKKNTETLAQIDAEIQLEVKNLKQKNKDDMAAIQDMALKAKSEVSITNKKINQQQQEAQEQEDLRKIYEDRRKTNKETLAKLKAEIEDQQKQISERDKTIGEKERKIYELKKRSQELEKFKFVLDHKIKELKRDIGPRDDEIARMKDETNKMDQKLKYFNAINNSLGTIVDELDTTQEQMKEQIKKQRAQISHQNVKIKQFKDDVYKAVQHILNYEELREEIEKLKISYVKDDIKKVDIDEEIKTEYQSQKKYLERSVQLLKKNLIKDNEIHKQDNIRIMRENVDLIKEINILRKQIKEIKFTKSEKTAGQQQQNQVSDDENNNENNLQQQNVNYDDIQRKQQLLETIQQDIQEMKEIEEALKEQNEELRQRLNIPSQQQ